MNDLVIQNAEHDVNYALTNLKALIDKSTAMLEKVATIVDETNDDPRMAIKYVEACKDLSNIVEKYAHISQKASKGKSPNHVVPSSSVTNNTNNGPVIFTSSAELLKHIESKYNGVKTIEEMKQENFNKE